MKIQPAIPIEIAPIPIPADSTAESRPPREGDATATPRDIAAPNPVPSPAHERLLETYRLWSETGR